jgi:hypothetical protein
MKCQEVIELMQRYLDQDLNELEYNQMLAHMQQCSECTELFQRLVGLSHELEQLPKVTPAYSLVDAIMPKLQLIDKGLPIEDIPMAAALAAAPVGADAKLSEDIKSPVVELAGWRQRMRGLVSARIVGGVVAAGLVLGFFVFEQQQQSGSMKNADEMMLKSGSVQQSSAATADKKSASFEAKPDMNADSAKSTAPAAKESGKPSESSSVDTKAENAPMQQAPVSVQENNNIVKQQNQAQAAKPPAEAAQSLSMNRMGAESPAKAGSPLEEKAPSSPQQDNSASVNEQLPKSEQPLSDSFSVAQQQQLSQQAVPPAVSSPSEAAGSEVPSAKAGTPNQNPELSGAPSPEAALKKSPDQTKAGITSGNPEAKSKGIAEDSVLYGFSAVAARTMSSPDGVYTATINAERHVVITDQQGKAVYTSTRTTAETDTIALVKWDSGNMLTYQISNDSGTVLYVINVTEKTDAKK